MSKQTWTKLISCFLIIMMTLLNSACVGGGGGGGDVVEKPDDPTFSRGYNYTKKSDNLMQFYSSDNELDLFLNEYMERHLRYNKNAINDLQLGGGNSIWKEWESMAVMFMDVNGLTYNPKEAIKAWISSIFQDSFGYIWMDNGTDSTSWGQSWEFPNSSHSAGNTGVSKNNTYSFNNGKEGWTAYTNTDAAADSVVEVRKGTLGVTGKNMRTVTFETDAANELMANTFHAPFLELTFAINDNNLLITDQVEDILVSWKTASDTTYTANHCVKYSEFSSTQYQGKFPSTTKVVFPMYANSEWGANKDIKDMKIEVLLKNGMNGMIGLNEVDLSYDARQINNNGVFIAAVANYFEYTQDIEFLKANIDKVRRAAQFYLTYCDGASGLVSTKNFTGHDGSTNKDYFTSVPFNGGMSTGINGIGEGIGDGYWDCLSYPQVSSYCNNLYYLSLQKMLYLEQMLTEANVTTAGKASVKSADMKSEVTYHETTATLLSLLARSKTQYNNTFWNSKTGRYHLGVNQDGAIVDYGFTMFNEEAILYGLADDKKAESIMSWIDGTRTVAGDNSTGKNIYKYQFAPRWSTKNNEYQFWWRFNGKTGAHYKWDKQIQNGGVAIHQAYYDLAATEMVKGTQDSFAKLNKIKDWYYKVRAKKGEGKNFYAKYYLDFSDDSMKLQGGSGGAGAIGLDNEFLEAAILYTAIPDTYFGLGSSAYKTLNVTPNLPKSLTYWKMENLSFSNLVYDISIGQNFVQINSIRGKTNGEKVKVTLTKPTGSYEVRQHNKTLVEGVDYIVVGNQIVVTAPFINGRIQVLEIK